MCNCNCECNKNNKNVKNKKNILTNVYFVIILGIILLIIGTLGFYIYEKLDWITSLYDASTILAVIGMGRPPETKSGKIFGTFYSFFIGLFYVYLVTFIVLAYLKNNNIIKCNCNK